jgi:hypothetical protein
MTQGFYKHDGNQFLYAPNFVEGSDFVLLASQKDNYQYPVSGWLWAESEPQAASLMGGYSEVDLPNYHVSPEDFYLKTNKSDETEFTKLITLIQLSLNAGAVTLSSVIKIKDSNSSWQEVTVNRFFQIMIGYGFFCYNLRTS